MKGSTMISFKCRNKYSVIKIQDLNQDSDYYSGNPEAKLDSF